ncbi:MAG: CPBP family intramembrane metalloprotease [Actinomycetota bacterium]|nr:CPBP family intramembrane metalloprotease [Actinomycetota bacterium]
MSKRERVAVRTNSAVAAGLVCLVAVIEVIAVVAVQGNATTIDAWYFVPRLLLAALTLVLARWLAPYSVAENQPGLRRGLLLGVPAYAVMVLALIAGLTNAGPFKGWAALGVFTLSIVSVGVFEELLFRGVLLGTIRRTSWGRTGLRAALLSSAVFGAAHLVNLPREGLGPTIAQVVYAVLIGVFFAAVRIRSGSLLAVIVLHALLDWSFYLGSDVFARASSGSGSGIVSSLISVLVGVLLAAWGVRLLRRQPPLGD